MHSGNAGAGGAAGDLLDGEAGDASLFDGTQEAVITIGHAVLVVDVPAAEEVDLFAAVVGLAVVYETDRFLAKDGFTEVTVGVEGNAGGLRDLFEVGEEPGVAEAGEDHVGVVLAEYAVDGE